MSSQETEKSGEKALSEDGQLHKPPSMLWFVIPLGLLMLYALFTR
jgi:hypothetical protein